MSRDDAPNYRETESREVCVNCDWHSSDGENLCYKHGFFIMGTTNHVCDMASFMTRK